MEFVDFELAKKLKEKGFEQCYNIFGYRPIYSDENTIRFISSIGAYEKEYFGLNIFAPTISQVLKRLREKYFIHISTKPYPCEDGLMWLYEIRKFNPYICHVVANKAGFLKEKQAALAGIEYLLENLI